MFKRIFSFLLLATSLVACTGDYTDWAAPQHNDAEELVFVNNAAYSEVGLIDFASIPADQEYVKVCNINASVTEQSPEYNNFSYEIDLGFGESMASYPLTANGEMKVEDLKQYIEKKFGKAPVEREINTTVRQWVSNGETAVFTAGSGLLLVHAKLDAPKISENYYIVGGTLDWAESAASKSQKFSHSSQSVYDDPVFTITIPAAEGDTWFAIGDDEALEAIGNGDWSKLLGTTGASEDLSGMLKPRYELDGDHSLCVPAGPKFIKVEINMMDGTYKITPISFDNALSYVGTAGGWNNAGGQSRLALTDATKGLYTGFIYGKQESYGNTFRLFSPSQLGTWDGSTGNSDVDTFSGSITAGGSDNNFEFTDGDGVYYVEYCVTERTISATKINNMNLVGDFNGWSADDAAQQMTWNADELCFVKENTGVSASGWKFTANNDWGINLGGDLINLVQNGGNIFTVGSKIKLYPCRNTSDNIYCTVE